MSFTAKFVWPVRVQFNETDAMGVVHHANYIKYVEQARVEFLRDRGLSYREVTDSGVHLAVIDLRFKYLRPSRFDDRLDVKVAIDKLGRASADFVFEIYRGDERICEGYTKLACVTKDGRLQSLPSHTRNKLLG